jgi:hypothetical protein
MTPDERAAIAERDRLAFHGDDMDPELMVCISDRGYVIEQLDAERARSMALAEALRECADLLAHAPYRHTDRIEEAMPPRLAALSKARALLGEEKP